MKHLGIPPSDAELTLIGQNGFSRAIRKDALPLPKALPVAVYRTGRAEMPNVWPGQATWRIRMIAAAPNYPAPLATAIRVPDLIYLARTADLTAAGSVATFSNGLRLT